MIGASDECFTIGVTHEGEFDASINGGIQVECTIAGCFGDSIFLLDAGYLFHAESWDAGSGDPITIFDIAVDVTYPDSAFAE